MLPCTQGIASGRLYAVAGPRSSRFAHCRTWIPVLWLSCCREADCTSQAACTRMPCQFPRLTLLCHHLESHELSTPAPPQSSAAECIPHMQDIYEVSILEGVVLCLCEEAVSIAIAESSSVSR